MLPTSGTVSIPECVALSWVKGEDAEEEEDGFHGLLELWGKQVYGLYPQELPDTWR